MSDLIVSQAQQKRRQRPRAEATRELTKEVALLREKHAASPAGMAYCVRCETYKDRSRFSNRTRMHDKPRSYCKDCVNLYHASRKAKSKVIMRKRNLNHRFGITEAEYQEMSDAQGARCAICGEVETRISRGSLHPLTVDHDHETGRIRGLLCAACNLGLGSFRDSMGNLANAIDYLMGTHR